MTQPIDDLGLTEQQMEALLAALRAGPSAAVTPPAPALARILDLPVTLRVELGNQQCVLSEVLALGGGKLLELNRGVDQPLAVRIGDRLLALGRAVVVGGKFGVEIVSLAPPELVPSPVVRRLRTDAPAATRVVPPRI